MDTKIIIVDILDENTRLDRFLVDNLEDVSRANIHKLIEKSLITVKNKVANKNLKVKAGDVISITLEESVDIGIIAEDIPLNIVYEDDDIVVVNKEKGMVAHPAPGNPSGTLVNALMYHCKGNLSGINGEIRPGIVHRIDKYTSGLLVVAKNDIAHNGLSSQIKSHTMTREYRAVVYGRVKEDEGTIDAPIGRNKVDRKKMCVTRDGRESVTHYFVEEELGDFTLMKLKLETGRTHQIRVHMASVYHPLAGDDVYGPKKVIKTLNGQCLHAKTLGFIHPTKGEYMEFNTELPTYFADFVEMLRRKNS